MSELWTGPEVCLLTDFASGKLIDSATHPRVQRLGSVTITPANWRGPILTTTQVVAIIRMDRVISPRLIVAYPYTTEGIVATFEIDGLQLEFREVREILKGLGYTRGATRVRYPPGVLERVRLWLADQNQSFIERPIRILSAEEVSAAVAVITRDQTRHAKRRPATRQFTPHAMDPSGGSSSLDRSLLGPGIRDPNAYSFSKDDWYKDSDGQWVIRRH